jgi:ribonuclease HII
MPYLIGTDEAGYAPNLGPLVISASVWWVDPQHWGQDLYRHLRAVVCKTPNRRGSSRAAKLAIADSKQLYSSATGIGCLERGVLAALALVNRCPTNWLDVWNLLDPRAADSLPAVPWHANYDLRLPLAADADDLERLVARTRRGFERAGVKLVSLRSRAVFPEEFNRATATDGNKSETLSKTTLALLAQALADCQGEPVLVVCDKHGGRNQYSRHLQQQFPDVLIEVHHESMSESIYRFGPEAERIEVRFCMGGESFLPTALASMTSKYLRELAMRAFNDFWCGRVTDLAPTAGYPGDARRFMNAIEAARSELGIDHSVLWRAR